MTVGGAWVLLFVFLGGCQHWPSGTPVPQNLRSYERKQILSAINVEGHEYAHVSGVRRNASGTKLFVRVDAGAAVVVLSEREAPQVKRGWLDEDGEVVARHDAQGNVVFKDGRIREKTMGVESRGVRDGFYFESNPTEGSACIFDLNDPTTPLYCYRTTSAIESLDVRNGDIWVLELNHDARTYVYRVLRRDGPGYRQERLVELPYGKHVVDIDPWSSAVILKEEWEFTPTKWFLFDVETNELTDLGAADLRVAVFLASDILGCDRFGEEREN